MRPRTVFLIGFLVTLIFQGWVWSSGDFVDSGIWEPAAESIAAHGIPHVLALENGFPVPLVLYPGVPLLIPAAILISHGVAADTALRVLMPLLLALLVGGITAVCAQLAPRTGWWAAVLPLFSLSHVYMNATPPSALSMAFIPLITLLMVWAGRAPSVRAFVALGVIGGFALSTRFDISALALGISLLYLALSRFRLAVLAGVLSVAVFAVLDPYAHSAPLLLFHQMFGVIGHFYHSNAITLPTFGVIQSLPLGFLGIALTLLACGALGSRAPLHGRELIFLLIATFLPALLLLRSSYHPNWYFYPLITLWEPFAALSLIWLLRHAPKTAFFARVPEQVRLVLVVAAFSFVQLIVYVHPLLAVAN